MSEDKEPSSGSLPVYMTRVDVAAVLRIHPKTVSIFVRRGRLECQWVGSQQRFTREHVDKFLRGETRRHER